MQGMKTDPVPRCPFHAATGDTSPQAPAPEATAWPPGPAPGITGWGLLRAMSRDLPGTLDRWRKEYGDRCTCASGPSTR
jgi:hypothetical protein